MRKVRAHSTADLVGAGQVTVEQQPGAAHEQADGIAEQSM